MGAGTMITAAVVLVPLVVVVVERLWTLAPGHPAHAATAVLAIVCTDVSLPVYFRLVRTHGSVDVASKSHLRAGVGVVLGKVFWTGASLRRSASSGRQPSRAWR